MKKYKKILGIASLVLVVLFLLGKSAIHIIHENDLARLQKSKEFRENKEKSDREYKEKIAKEDAGRTLYDPSQCKTDAEGMVYWAAGSHLFRFPYDLERPLYSRGDTRFETPVNIPDIDKNELEGCPNNPLRGAVPYADQYVRNLWKELSGYSYSAILRRGTGIKAVDPVVLYSSKLNPTNFESLLISNKKSCYERIEGFVECFWPSDLDVKLDETTNRLIRISSDVRGMQKGRDLYLSAGGHINPQSGMHVSGGDVLYESIRLSYGFDVYPKDLPLLVQYDKKIRSYIDSAHFISY